MSCTTRRARCSSSVSRADAASRNSTYTALVAHRFAVSVVRGVGADDATFARCQAGDLQRHLDRLGPATAEYDTLDPVAVQGGESLGELDDALVQIAAVHVQRRLLIGHGRDDTLVAMSDTWHVVVHVDIPIAVSIKEVSALAADDVERLTVEEWSARAERLVSASY